MKSIKQILLFLLITNNAIAQNIVKNGSFEIFSQRDNQDLDMKYCSGWDYSITHGLASTPDHIIANDTNIYPLSSQGQMSAYTGNCFAGFTNNEFLISRFEHKMEKDSLYRISFWICLSPNSDYYSSCLHYTFLSESSFEFHNQNMGESVRKNKFDSIINNMIQIPIESGSVRNWHLFQFEYVAKGTEAGFSFGVRYKHENALKEENCVQLCPESRIKLNRGTVNLKQLYYFIDYVSVSKMNTLLPIGKPVIATDILFETNKSELDPRSIFYIREIADYLHIRLELKIVISGYTDNIGSEQQNLKLSLERAEAVKQILITLIRLRI